MGGHVTQLIKQLAVISSGSGRRDLSTVELSTHTPSDRMTAELSGGTRVTGSSFTLL